MKCFKPIQKFIWAQSRILSCLIIFSCCFQACKKEELTFSLDNHFIRFYGENDGMTIAKKVLRNSDGSFFLLATGGSIFTDQVGLYLKNIDLNGIQSGENLLSGKEFHVGRIMSFTNENDLLIAGDTLSGAGDFHVPFLIRYVPTTSSSGSETGISFTQTYSPSAFSTQINDMEVQPDGSMILLGTAEADNQNFYPVLIRVDQDGLLIWDTVYTHLNGSKGIEIVKDPGSGFDMLLSLDDIGFRFIKLADNGIITQTLDFDQQGLGPNYLPVQLMPWQGGYLVGGNSLEFGNNFLPVTSKIALTFIDNGGGKIWEKVYRTDSTHLYGLSEIAQTQSEEGLLLIGAEAHRQNENGSTYVSQLLLMKLDTEGKVEWEVSHGTDPANLIGFDVEEVGTTGGGYVSFGNYTQGNREMVVLIKTDAKGEL